MKQLKTTSFINNLLISVVIQASGSTALLCGQLIRNMSLSYHVTEQCCFPLLKEYYEIVDEARPLLGFFPTYADFVTEMHF